EFLVAMVGFNNNDVDVLKKTIWLEARGEPYDGQVAVAHVIKNRAETNRGYWGGNTISGVCLYPQQFECWNNRQPQNTHPQGEGWNELEGIARGVLGGTIRDPTNGESFSFPSLIF
ncbi:hypothetical protein PFISCL1PPCAC_6854, partial [Pristionchus fissidentatus]